MSAAHAEKAEAGNHRSRVAHEGVSEEEAMRRLPRRTTSTSVRRQRSHRWNKRVRHFDGDEDELQDWMVALVSDE
jgi:hypothetical protein